MAPRPNLTRYVSNQGSRGGNRPRIIVIHTTESHDRGGTRDIRGIISYFDTPSAQASSHVVNDREGNDARLVADERAAWTQGRFNQRSLSIEQIAFARYSSAEWMKNRRAQLMNTASWVAYWSARHGIPVQRGRTSGCDIAREGVVTHEQLGCGNTHTDPGDGYPLASVIAMAADMRRGMSPAEMREERWRRSLRIQRSRLRRILRSRVRLRRAGRGTQRDPDYRYLTRALRSTRERIRSLLRLIRRR